eukprot:CAMPEP_0172462570 /NCGR_PEP_ID=MMETSP1065-20121228/44174_1 /TAXON_ID=265537 /ORGANISM="Amphiprora paludosa, Strain CCMP125" /LENGTH=337 /DNA_ID=CAMNT_0013218259 /DNA_START=279 /DNA_END=1292 /DNA_ORIENTATION=-
MAEALVRSTIKSCCHRFAKGRHRAMGTWASRSFKVDDDGTTTTFGLTGVLILASIVVIMKESSNNVAQCSSGDPKDSYEGFLERIKSSKPPAKDNLPEYTAEEVAKRNGRDSGSTVWMSYGGNVYDVTAFIPYHPGGTTRISRAAGTAIEPFWYLHQQHFRSEDPARIMDHLVIGRLKESDQEAVDHELEKVQERLDGFRLVFDISAFARSAKSGVVELSLEKLQELPRSDSNSTFGCPQSNHSPVSMSVFAGVRLQDLLEAVPTKLKQSPNKENAVVVFHAMDGDTMEVELDGNILICDEMNGAPLTQARGFPLRILFPGKKRVIKWVQKVEVRPK